ncbi:MAG TPA: nucleotidyltransferase family protein [Pyrinomonadaceae bacterium]|nr:nucleotidyltransferase family protein [Pyrinomonadaceae bacterium]
MKTNERAGTSPAPTNHALAAILLAAGRSRRMGAFKPLLPFGDKTVVECCVQNLRDAGIHNIIVVVGHRAEEIRRQLKNFDVIFALNPDPDSEMGASIARGVEALSQDVKAVLIALVDHPAVPSEIIKSLIEEWRLAKAKLIQPEHESRGGHPVLIDLVYRDELLNLDPRRGLRALFDKHREQACRLPVESPFIARDMDTWEDYLALHEAVFGMKPSPMAGFGKIGSEPTGT